MPDGARGALLKLNSPSNITYADSLGSFLDACIRLSGRSACVNSSHHNCIGNNLLTVQMLAMKWFLKVWIALSAAVNW